MGVRRASVAITHLDVEVANPGAPDGSKTVRFLIDSGAINSVVPAAILEALGIRPLSEQDYRLANGDVIRRKRGGAAFRYRGRVGVADVVFGEPGDANLLGATTLESLGYGLDPIKRDLIELPMTL
jgi:clan AA aspartic protease